MQVQCHGRMLETTCNRLMQAEETVSQVDGLLPAFERCRLEGFKHQLSRMEGIPPISFIVFSSVLGARAKMDLEL